MQTLRNLRLSARLGGAFGLVAVLLLAIAVLGATRLGVVKNDVNQLASHEIRAQALVGQMAERSSATINAVTQHLYVFDGNLKEEDALAAEIKAAMTADDADAAKLAPLVAGTPAAARPSRPRATLRAVRAEGREGPSSAPARRPSTGSSSATARARST